MKKFAILILTVFYMVAATGATVNIHYCMGEYAGWDIGHQEEGSCNSCGMEKTESDSEECCRDEHKVVKLDDVHKNATAFVSLLSSPEISPLYQVPHTTPEISKIQESYPVVNAPPGNLTLQSFIFIRSIRI